MLHSFEELQICAIHGYMWGVLSLYPAFQSRSSDFVAFSAQESAKALKTQLDQQKGVVEKLISNTRV